MPSILFNFNKNIYNLSNKKTHKTHQIDFSSMGTKVNSCFGNFGYCLAVVVVGLDAFVVLVDASLVAEVVLIADTFQYYDGFDAPKIHKTSN